MPEILVLREEVPPTVEGRTLTCRIATYGRVYQPTPTLRERIMRGALKAPMARPSGVLRYRHQGERPGDTDRLDDMHGVVTALREDGDAVLAEVEVFDGLAGDKILRLVQADAVTGVSLAAVVADSTRRADGVVDIRRVSQLHGVSLTPNPAYDDARVLAVRERVSDARRATEAAWWRSLGMPDRIAARP